MKYYNIIFINIFINIFIFIFIFIIFYIINFHFLYKIETFKKYVKKNIVSKSKNLEPKIININNLFNFCIEKKKEKNVFLQFNKKLHGNSMMLLMINNDNKILTYSNEWLYLIKSYYPKNNIYHDIIKTYNNILINKTNANYIDENVISFLTSFSTGTIHGYSALYHMLIVYIRNINYYKNFKIIVAKNSQEGILNIINHFIEITIFNKDNIIYLEPDKIYKFKSVIFIPNDYHIILTNNFYFSNSISNIIHKYIILKNTKKIEKHDNICILKTSNSINLTNDGIVSNDIANIFNKKYNLNKIEPGSIDEISLINIIYSCKIFVVSWGTAFFKNFVYISNNCRKIIVLIIGEEFIKQYNNFKDLPKKFKNANIIYKIINNNLDEDISNLINN
jgi:hypothetical protein